MALYSGGLLGAKRVTLDAYADPDDTFFVELMTQTPSKERGWLISTLQYREDATTLSRKLVLWSLSMEE